MFSCIRSTMFYFVVLVPLLPLLYDKKSHGGDYFWKVFLSTTTTTTVVAAGTPLIYFGARGIFLRPVTLECVRSGVGAPAA